MARCTLYALSALAVLALVALARPAAALVLVQEGQPRATIVVADEPTPSAAKAAAVLQATIERMSGARLPIRGESAAATGSRILVGHSEAARRLGAPIPSGFTPQLDEEGFVMRTVGGDLLLAGNEDWQYRGTEIAVNKLLESLGCRWFFPGDYGEVIPKRATVEVAQLDRAERPSFRLRNIWFSGWIDIAPDDAERFAVWYERNNLSHLPGNLPGDGSVTRLAPADQYFDSHRHIYAVDEAGESVPDMLCPTEPEAVDIAVATISDYFRTHPEEVAFGFAPPDGHPRCHCEDCRAAIPGFTGKGYGDPSLSDLWFGFANQVAAGVYEEFPDRWVLTNGYANRVRLPEGIGDFAPNLGIQSAIIATCTLHRIGDPKCWQRRRYQNLLDRWSEELDWVFIYDYDPGKGLDGLPFPALHNLRHDLPYFHRRGIWGFWTEGNNGWMISHLNYYVRARLMWDVDEDVDAIVRDYCEVFYGAAADAVEAYLWVLEAAVEDATVHETWGRLTPWKHILTPAIVGELDGWLERAQRQALDDTARLHVDVLRQVHEHMKSYLAMIAAIDAGDFQRGADLAAQMLAMRDELAAIDAALIPHTNPQFRDFRSTTEWHRDMYQGLADRTAGADGELLLMLPRTWEFKTDPKDVGVLERWYLADVGDGWEPIDVTTYWEAQGYQDEEGWGYWGKAWYRHRFELPTAVVGEPVTLTLGAVYNRGVWVWVNGELLAFNDTRHDVRTPLDIDVTAIMQPGANTVAVLVNTPMPGRNPRGGLHRRAFLWRPKQP